MLSIDSPTDLTWLRNQWLWRWVHRITQTEAQKEKENEIDQSSKRSETILRSLVYS